jgi:hypothetical protein
MKMVLSVAVPVLLWAAGAEAQTVRKAVKTPPPTTTVVTVTDQGGAPLGDVRVNLIGILDRSGTTQPDGTVKFDGMRPGLYRLRFVKDGYITLEREFEVRAGQPPPTPSVALTPAPPPPKPPPPPSEPPKPSAPSAPPGRPLTVAVPDFIERNLITGTQPQKVSQVACSGLASTALWQIREPWTDRQHTGVEVMLYVVAGEGQLRMDGRDSPLQAGSFASIPRGTAYSLTRRGRNPLIVLATLSGEPCIP